MNIGSASSSARVFASLFGSGGFKRTLSAAFALLLAGALIVSYFIHDQAYRAATVRAADELAEAHIDRVAGAFDAFMNQSVELAARNSISIKYYPHRILPRLPEILAEQLASYPMVEIIAVGFADGEYAEAQRLGDGSIRLGRAGSATGGALSLYRLDAEGQLVEELRREGYDPRTRPWYVDAVARGRPGLSDPYEILTTGSMAVAANEPVLDGDGQLLGVTTVTINLSRFREQMAAMAASFDGYVAIFDAERRLLVSSSADHPAAGLMGDRTSGRPARAQAGGTTWRYIVRSYLGRSDTRRLVLIALSEDRFMAPLASVGRNIALIYLATLLVFSALSFFVIRIIGEPLRILRDEVARMGSSLADGSRRGEVGPSEYLPILASRKDELGHLAMVFTSLMEDLSRTILNLSKSLEDKEILLKEVHHRVKNNLQIISSMLSLHGGATEDPQLEEILEDLRDRVHAMALVHEVIYSSGSFSAVPMDDYLGRLMRSLSVYDRRGASIRLDQVYEGLTLPLERAIPCALVAVELATNAFKHAFKGREEGVVRIVLTRRDSRLRLAVEDDGVGMQEDPDPAGMGTTIVAALVQQLGGKLELSSGPWGTNAAIIFPE